MNKLYGWYSLNAYKKGEKEYIYIDTCNQEAICTVVSEKKERPYKEGSPYRKKVVYVGELTYFIRTVDESE